MQVNLFTCIFLPVYFGLFDRNVKLPVFCGADWEEACSLYGDQEDPVWQHFI